MIGSLGETLRLAREARGLSLSDIAAMTKISTRALTAIEHEDFDRLPAGVFRRAYVKAFAGEVGLDADECVQSYVEHWEPPPAPPPAEPRRVSWSDDQLRAVLAIFLVTGVLFITVVVVAVRLMTGGRTEPAALSPESRVALPAATHGASPAAAPSPAAAAGMRIRIEVTRPCWISATADGARSVRRLVKPGETIVVDADAAIILSVGDAGAISYTMNGAPGRALGQPGEPVTVRITPTGVETLSRQARRR